MGLDRLAAFVARRLIEAEAEGRAERKRLYRKLRRVKRVSLKRRVCPARHHVGNFNL